MKPTKEQIAYLFRFCRRHGAIYYEVQAELADHLLDAVGASMQERPYMAFELAVDQVFEKFGKNGFAEISKQKQDLLTRQLSREFWRAVQVQFYWPRILPFLLWPSLFFCFFYISFRVGLFIVMAAVAAALFSNIYHQYTFSRFIKKSGEEFMTAEYLRPGAFVQLGWTMLVAFILIYFHALKAYIHDSFWLAMGISLFAGICLVLGYAFDRILVRYRLRLANRFPLKFYHS